MRLDLSYSTAAAVFINIIAIVLGTLAVRSWIRAGVPAPERWKRLGVDFQALWLQEFAVGFGIGTFAMAGAFLTHLWLGYLQLAPARWPVPTLAQLGVLFAFGAAMEELLFRGFMINGLLALRRSPLLAVSLSALLFGLAHLANPNATAISVFSTMIGGVMYALAFLWSGRLWLPWSLHLAWNFVQGPVFGFPVSGMRPESIVQIRVMGPPLMTGGDYGPEGGLIGIAFRMVVILLLFLWRTASRTGSVRNSSNIRPT